MAPSSYSVALLLVSALVSCGGKSFEETPDPNHGGADPGGSSSGGNAPVAGSAQGGANGKGGMPSAGSGQGGSAGSVCDAFDDDLGASVNVAIYNRTSVPIYLGQEMLTCGVSPLFQVQGVDGVTLPSPGDCRSPCQSLRDMGPAGCPAICRFPSSLSLQPGQAAYTRWDGLFQVQTQLPSQCVAPGYGAASCDQAKLIQPGTFTFSAQAGSSIHCDETIGMCSACMPDSTGGCITPAALIGGTIRTATTTVLLDGGYGIYASDSPPPVPAGPGNPAGDAPGPAVPARMVELFFTD